MSAARSFVGTEGFIPPEGPGSAQADIFSLGKVLYEISTGKDRHAFPELPSLLGDSPELKDLLELNEVVVKACATDVEKRHKSAEELHAELLLLQGGKSVKRLRLLERRMSGCQAFYGRVSEVRVASRPLSTRPSRGKGPIIGRTARPGAV